MHPYSNLPEKAFWRTAVADKSFFDIRGLWSPKFEITAQTPTITFGSCFAQHFGHALQDRGFSWLETERAPRELSPENARRFNYGLFSCRTGNIYTTSLLLQWLRWASGAVVPPEEYWEKDGRIYDPFRPNVEPEGFATVDEMRQMRQLTVDALVRAVRRAGLFVFTLGLTESWFNREHGYEYPMCPGTVAGVFDENNHLFMAQDFGFIADSLRSAIAIIRKINPAIKVLLTVSPVPLTATNSGAHVLVASSLSKSILRAVTGQITRELDFVDYFPSFEIINSPVYRGAFSEPNLRGVNPAGVSLVMKNFFHDLGDIQAEKPPQGAPEAIDDSQAAICEEEMLAAFSIKGDNA